jgi:hypothetical protein
VEYIIIRDSFCASCIASTRLYIHHYVALLFFLSFSGRYNGKENSIAMPFLKRPNKLDGSHAGDYGFDPLGLSEEYDLYTMQEAEVRHARLAMLAVVGWPLSELVAPDWMLQEGGCAPSVLNGFNPLSALATLAVFGAFGFFEYKTALRRSSATKFGLQHADDMADVWSNGVVGDYDFDPLNLYQRIAGDSAYARKGIRDVEIGHGRMAMLGITAFAASEALTGDAIVSSEAIFFHPNPILPALVAAYVAFKAIYTVESSDGQYLFQIKKTSEGEVNLEKLQLAMRSNEAVMTTAGALVDKAMDVASAGYEKVVDGSMDKSSSD